MLQETQKARNRCNYNNDLHIIGSHNRVGEYGALSIATHSWSYRYTLT